MITAWIGSITLLGVAILYGLLALGMPYGEFAMGGKYQTLPKKMRLACVLSLLIQLAAILFLLQMGNVLSIVFLAPMAKEVCYFFALYLFLNTVLNAFSKSRKETFVMTPLSFIAAVCFLLTAWNG
ncbi:hypothetical protein [Halobacillus sp. Nhm2S1]|uniref:hypothetical protein n=1 Tax=Halobacillus sp. Nhm2S1 TaxID=2866716 RepID=UPI001C73C314|nr:hypothetical protein [Halobacillus sp. Nhm2S1]MBX0358509.1 hypothetical protein [Halobacillus sp. Nhm2S1]